MKRLAKVLNVPLPRVLARLEQRKGDPLTPVTIQVAVHEEQVAYLSEHAREFPGVQVRQTFLRKYNTEALLAHVLGYTGEISPDPAGGSPQADRTAATAGPPATQRATASARPASSRATTPTSAAVPG